MTGELSNTPFDVARRMLEAFASVGVKTFDLTLTTRAGEKADFRRGLTGERLSHTFSRLLAIAETRQQNVIVRPNGADAMLVQLDDLKTAAALAQVKPVAFLALHTSPGNHQAWIAVSDPGDADFARRLKKGAGADPTASGATRVAGSVNFKDKYAPDFPRVAIAHLALARIVTVQELTDLKLVAPPEEPPGRVSPPAARPAGSLRIWPDYQRCLDGAPRNHGDTGIDVSRADFTWCRTALGWGFKIDEVAARLLEQSSKAKEAGQGERYAQLTAENAAASLKREASAKPQFRPT
jgi:hypothetical protein